MTQWYRVNCCPVCDDPEIGGYVALDPKHLDGFNCDADLHDERDLTDDQREDLYHEAIEAANDREF